MLDQRSLGTELAHVLWIGGSTCCGKTTIANALAEQYHGVAYHFDRMEMRHIERTTEATNPELMAFLAMDMEQRWLLRPPSAMARNAIASWAARFTLVLEDLRALPKDVPIIAEGPGLFPACVAPLLTHPRQAVWLVTSESLCTIVREQRGGSYLETSDPPRSLRNIVERDLIMARYVRRQATAQRLPWYQVDGSRSLADMTARVEDHFAPYLRSRHG